MRFILDTNDRLSLNLELEDMEHQTLSAIQSFSYGIASFFTEFMSILQCDTEEKATEVRKVLLSCVEKNIDEMIYANVLFDCNDDFISASLRLREEMENRGFSEEEIKIYMSIIESNGIIEKSIEVAINDAEEAILKLSEESGVEMMRKQIEVIRKIL